MAQTRGCQVPTPRNPLSTLETPYKKVSDILGIIVAFDPVSLRGLVLLKHRNDKSLSDVYVRFTDGNADKKHRWIAKFEWKAFTEGTQNSLRRSKKRRLIPRKQIMGRLIGSVVLCTVEKKQKWEVVRIDLQPSSDKYKVKNLWTSTETISRRDSARSTRGSLSTGARQRERRDYASHSTMRSNVRRPWRG